MEPQSPTESGDLESFAREIGSRIALARKARGFARQQDLADALAVDRTTVMRWESGNRVPRPQYQVDLCRVLEKSHEDLFGLVAVAS